MSRSKPYSKINNIMGDVIFSAHYSRCDDPCGMISNGNFSGLVCEGEEGSLREFCDSGISQARSRGMSRVILEELGV